MNKRKKYFILALLLGACRDCCWCRNDSTDARAKVREPMLNLWTETVAESVRVMDFTRPSGSIVSRLWIRGVRAMVTVQWSRSEPRKVCRPLGTGDVTTGTGSFTTRPVKWAKISWVVRGGGPMSETAKTGVAMSSSRAQTCWSDCLTPVNWTFVVSVKCGVGHFNPSWTALHYVKYLVLPSGRLFEKFSWCHIDVVFMFVVPAADAVSPDRLDLPNRSMSGPPRTLWSLYP